MEDSEDVERGALIQRLKPEAVEDYLEAHEDVPCAVSNVMRQSGVRQFQLFVSGDLSVGYIEAEDLQEFATAYSADPGCQKWEETVGEYKVSGVDTDDGELPLMEKIWSFTEDV